MTPLFVAENVSVRSPGPKLKISPENYLKKAKINEDSTVSDDLNVEDNNICIICGQEPRHIFKLLHLYRNLVDSKFHGKSAISIKINLKIT